MVFKIFTLERVRKYNERGWDKRFSKMKNKQKSCLYTMISAFLFSNFFAEF